MSLLTLVIALLAAGCGGSGDGRGGGDGGGGEGTKTTGASGSIDTPPPLDAAGEFLFCTDVPYPPAEYQENGEFVGYEIDIAKEVGNRLGVEATFQKTGFDGIIAALKANRCDAIISSMNNTEERRKEVDFVDYMEVGQSLMATTDTADEISTLDDLAGRQVAVQVGTTLRDALEKKSKELEADGKEPIKVSTFPDAGAAANALQTNKVDVFFGDSPVVAEYVNRDPEKFAFAGEPVDPLPVGIALRKQDRELRDAVQQAIDDMYEDGTMIELLKKWKVDDFALDGGGEGSPTATTTTGS